ncbi:hypothetical protein [Amycolatopsis sp. cmx-11-32]|uniref:hypothetical protein n=1 Tax=Amycolatopsis sp. cmx-11-32 TaxID=2785796 RepID=UPI0039E2677A
MGNAFAGRATDTLGSARVRSISLAGSTVTLALVDVAVLSLPGALVLALASGVFGGMLMVPQQHRLFSLAPDAPTVALGLNGSAIYGGGALGAALGGVVLSSAGIWWVGPVAAFVALLAFALSLPSRAQAPRPA